MPSVSSLNKPQSALEVDSVGFPLVEETAENVNGIIGPGLKNEVGEYNCFLNVIIQVGFPTQFC